MLLPLLMLIPGLAAQVGPANPQPVFHDDLLEQMVGAWNLTGSVRGQPVHETVFAEWILNHQFLVIHRKQLDGPNEAFLYIGYDNVSDRYVVHRLDNMGGRGSEFLGYGIRTGDKIQFVYEYPTRPYRQTFSFDAKERSWQFLLETKEGKTWAPFATETLHPLREGPHPRGPARGKQP
jgi:hypothetical protein